MNFIEAVKLAKEGKKIKRKYNNYVWEMSSTNVLYSNDTGNVHCSRYTDVIADDWEVVED